ncbi:NUDIX domain-containing protein [Planctomyces sp. SH-PL62]|uniref:NUDIX domain-containing protein n=1 Tax=Planctomyces sp. SH-PL62 TaxID=1636152 RepID=UPI00078ECC00|nr:NUDIX domain-containing protein [Planctomyces sp. SH-PL62]AMV38993.1 Putative mutator protein MutT4 [Planctomyces sp. SH-PL62]
MTTFHERSAGVIPYHRDGDGNYTFLVLHSATVRNPRAKWEFPKGGVEAGETPRQAAGREFQEETSLPEWSFRDGFERSLSYTYIRRGRKVVKTVTYYVVEVREPILPTRSEEHVADPHGHWFHWGSLEAINRLLYHTKIRQAFAEAEAWLQEVDQPAESPAVEPAPPPS